MSHSINIHKPAVSTISQWGNTIPISFINLWIAPESMHGTGWVCHSTFNWSCRRCGRKNWRLSKRSKLSKATKKHGETSWNLKDPESSNRCQPQEIHIFASHRTCSLYKAAAISILAEPLQVIVSKSLCGSASGTKTSYLACSVLFPSWSSGMIDLWV